MILDRKRAAFTRARAALIAENELQANIVPKYEYNSIESIRIACSLSRRQMLKIIGYKARGHEILQTPERFIDPVYIERSLKLLKYHDAWVALVLAKIEKIDGFIGVVDVAKVLDLAIMYVYKLMERGVVYASNMSELQEHMFTKEDVVDSFNRALNWLAADPINRTRGPMSKSFLSYLAASAHE